MMRFGRVAGLVGVFAIAAASACSSSSSDAGASDGGDGRGEVGSIDPVYGEPDSGVFLGGGGGGDDSFDAAINPEAGVATGLVLNEVDYDNVGTDNREFIEIYNATGGTLDLSNVAIVLVDTTSEYGRVDLSGTLAAGKYLLAASPNVTVGDAGAGVMRVSLPASSNALRNGTAAVGLLDKAKGTLLDAFSYGGSVNGVTVNGVAAKLNFVEGTAAVAVDSNTANGSLSRIPNGADSNNANADWKFSSTSTPGAANVP